MAVAAKDLPGAHRFAPAVVISSQIAVPNECADGLAMRTRRQLELLGNHAPVRIAAKKPSLLAHTDRAFPKIMILWARRSCGVEAGYDDKSLGGVRGKIPGRLTQLRQTVCQILGVINIPKSDENSATFTPKMRSERGKGQVGRWRNRTPGCIGGAPAKNGRAGRQRIRVG